MHFRSFSFMTYKRPTSHSTNILPIKSLRFNMTISHIQITQNNQYNVYLIHKNDELICFQCGV